MLLQKIVQQMDIELDRLYKLRAIVAELAHPVASFQEIAPEVEAASPVVEAPTQERSLPSLRRTRAYAPRGPRAKSSPTPEATALSSRIPTGPVVVSAQSLARERESRTPVIPKPETSTPTAPAVDAQGSENMARDLARRWLTNGDAAMA